MRENVLYIDMNSWLKKQSLPSAQVGKLLQNRYLISLENICNASIYIYIYAFEYCADYIPKLLENEHKIWRYKEKEKREKTNTIVVYNTLRAYAERHGF